MAVADRTYQEKRNFIRMKIETPAKIEIEEGNKQWEGVCRDLSGGGMLIQSETALPVGTEVTVHVISTHGHSPMLSARATVARIVAKPSEGSSSSMLGLEIQQVLE